MAPDDPFSIWLDERIARKEADRKQTKSARTSDLLQTEIAELYAVRHAYTEHLSEPKD
jgi:hypothetical protein